MGLRLKKKGVAILLISSIAFFIAILIFSSMAKVKVGPKTLYVGEIQFEIIDYYGKGEHILFFLDMAAKAAAKNVATAQEMSTSDFISKFKPEFEKYLKKFNSYYSEQIGKQKLGIKDYKISIIGNELIILTEKRLPITPLNLETRISNMTEYKINPSVTISLEKIAKLKKTATTTTTPAPTTPAPKPKSTPPAPTTSVTVPLRPGHEFSFVILSDTHVTSGNKYWPRTIVRPTIENIINQNPDLVIHNGDQISGSKKTKKSTVDGMWINFEKDVWKKFTDAGIIFAPGAGNHDRYNKALRDAYDNFYTRNKQKSLEDIISTGGDYPRRYSFDYKNSHFVIMYAPWYRINKDQREWLKSDLESAKNRNVENIFVFGHVALSPIIKSDGMNPRSELVKIFNDAGIRFFSNGHEHYYFKGEYQGVNVVSVGSSAYSRRIRRDLKRQNPSFVLVNVKGNKVTVKAIDYKGNELDPATVGLPLKRYSKLEDALLS